MSTWIKADYRFGNPYAIILADARQSERLWEAIHAEDPVRVEAEAVALIGMFRPELKGGCVLAMELDTWKMNFRIQYVHPALPKLPCGDLPPEIPLVPANADLHYEYHRTVTDAIRKTFVNVDLADGSDIRVKAFPGGEARKAYLRKLEDDLLSEKALDELAASFGVDPVDDSDRPVMVEVPRK